MAISPLRDLARQVRDLDRRVKGLGSSNQLAHSSIESGSLKAYEGDSQTMQIGRQWDGTYAPIVTNGPTPPTPSAPIVTDATQGLVIEWDGSFAGGLLPVPMDFARVDAHVGATSDFIPDHSNRRASFVAPQGGQVSVTLPDGTWYVKLVCWTLAGKVSAASDYTAGEALPPASAGSDGIAPASSPAVEVIGGYEIILARWTPIVNADPVTYDVHISTTSGFTPDSTTLAGSVRAGTQFTIKALPGVAPADPSDPDPRKLQYDTTYYVRVVARDDDGSAAPGAQGSDMIFRVTGSTIGADTIVGDNILGGTITGDLLASTMVLSTAFWTALTGQRAGFTPDGFYAYKPDNSLMFKLPTDGSTALYDGELVVRGATVTGGMSIQSSENELTSDAALTLMRGIAAPQANPQFADNYEKILLTTAGLTSAQKTGPLGTFDLAGGEIAFIEFKPVGPYWQIYQHRAGGTRIWNYDISGNPLLMSGSYFTDNPDYLIWSVTNLTTSSVPAKNGGYFIFQYIPDNYSYWVSSPAGMDRYSRQNGTATPVLGTDGEDMYVTEVLPATSGLSIRYFVPPGQGVNLPAPIKTHTTTTGYTPSSSLAVCTYHQSGFDRGAPRYLTAERGLSTNARLLSQNGTTGVWYPGGSGNSWVSSTKEAESFEAVTSNRRGIAWDGSNFWSFHADGYLYKHTNEVWDSGSGASTVWSQLTFRDTDAGGTGTHETLPGPVRTFTRKRRSRWQVTLPPPPDNGGTDDPNETALYSGVGNSQPANAAMFRQYSGLGPTNITTLATTGSVPPTVGTFPNANPAIIRSDDDALQIKGDGYGRYVSLQVGPAGGTAVDVTTKAPTITYITSSGTWTKPAGLKAAYVECVGGAGGTGGVAAGGAQAESGAGGSGSWNAKWYLASDLSSTESVTIGAGGNGGNTSGSDGTAGGSTIFKGQTAGPGQPGVGILASNTQRSSASGTSTGAGGSGGVATGGDINLPGEDGGHGRWINGLALLAARGGSTPMGYGMGGNARTGAGVNSGKGYGAGPGPAFAGTAAVAGASGQQGLVKITCYF